MSVDKFINWRTNKTRVVRRVQLTKDYRITPALENAGYRVPDHVLVREGFEQQLKRRRLMEELLNDPKFNGADGVS